MNCPICQRETKVINSRPADHGKAVKRRRECLGCHQRISTYERMSLVDIRVVKRNGLKEPFYRHKIEVGVRRALEKRPITEEQLQKMLFAIEGDIFNLERDTVSSEEIGRIVLDHLREVDKVAYLRFASVYRNFKTPKAFEREIQRLEKAGSG